MKGITQTTCVSVADAISFLRLVSVDVLHENAADFGGEASISLPCSLEENVLDVMRQTNAYRFS